MEDETRFLSCRMDACETSFRNAVRSMTLLVDFELELSLLLMPLFEACNLVVTIVCPIYGDGRMLILLLFLQREIFFRPCDDGCCQSYLEIQQWLFERRRCWRLMVGHGVGLCGFGGNRPK